MASTTIPAALAEKAPLVLSNWACPYVQRLTLALVHKGQKLSPHLNSAAAPANGDGGYVRELEINLDNKPSWLTQYSPLGKVPAVTYLEDGKERVLYESLALIQWVDEFYEGPALLPPSPADRALARIIIARFDNGAVPAFFVTMRAPSKEEFKVAGAKLLAELQWLEKHADPNGPFLLGAQPSLVDAVVAPWLLRFPILTHWRNVDLLDKLPRLKAFVEAYRQRPEIDAVLRTPTGETGYEAWRHQNVEIYGERYTKERVDYSDVDLSSSA